MKPLFKAKLTLIFFDVYYYLLTKNKCRLIFCGIEIVIKYPVTHHYICHLAVETIKQNRFSLEGPEKPSDNCSMAFFCVLSFYLLLITNISPMKTSLVFPSCNNQCNYCLNSPGEFMPRGSCPYFHPVSCPLARQTHPFPVDEKDRKISSK